jgi:hypothetical protein
MTAASCAGADHGESSAPLHPLRRTPSDDFAGAARGAAGPGRGSVLRTHGKCRRAQSQRDLPDTNVFAHIDADIHANVHGDTNTDTFAFGEPDTDADTDTDGPSSPLTDAHPDRRGFER